MERGCRGPEGLVSGWFGIGIEGEQLHDYGILWKCLSVGLEVDV